MPPVILPQLYWGSTLENRLDCGWPLEGAVAYPVPRSGSQVVQASDASAEDAVYLGTDHLLEADLRYVPGPDLPALLAGGSSAPAGLDALLVWARQRGLVRLVPDRTAPLNYVDGYLVEPTNGAPGVEHLDGSQRYHLKLRSQQRSYSEALRGLLFEYTPGMDLTTPRLFTNSRSTSAVYWDATGVVRTAAAGVTRDDHYPLGPLGARTTLLEPGAVNSLLQSQALATAPWVPNAVGTPTNNAATAPDLTATATKLVPDITNTSGHRDAQSVTVTDGENVAVSGYFKAAGYPAISFAAVSGSGAQSISCAVDLASGVIASSGGAGTGTAFGGAKIVPLGSGWYWVGLWGIVGTGLTTVFWQVNVFDTVAHAVAFTSYSGDAASGVLVWGCQFERNGAVLSPPTSYTATTSGTATRSADSASTPWPYLNQPLWGYAKFVDLGWAQRAAFSRLLTLANAAGGLARFTIMTGASSAGLLPGTYRTSYVSDYLGGAGDAAIVSSAVRGYGTAVELFWRWQYLAGVLDSTEMSVSINGGAVSTVQANGGASLVDLSSPTVLTLGASVNEGALVGLQALKLGSGPSGVTTLAQAAAA